MFSSVLYRIGIIFIILLVGALARRTKILTKETTDGLCRLTIEVLLPFLYFHTLSTHLNRELFLSIWTLSLVALALTFLSLFLGWLCSFSLAINPAQRKTFLFLSTFGNYGFLAIPLVYALFRQEGLVMIFVFNLGVTFLYWTLGLGILKGTAGRSFGIFKNLLHNATLALVLGLVVGITSFPVPQFILEISKLIGGASIPLALIVVGSILAHRDTSEAFSIKTIAMLIGCRLILIPAVVLIVVNFCATLPKMIAAIIVLQAAMPSASTTPILTKRFGGDTELAASGVFFTTLISIITIPLFLSLLL